MMATPGGNIFPDNAREGGPGFSGSEALQKFAEQIVKLNKAIDEAQKMAGLPKLAAELSNFNAKVDAITARIKLPFKLIGESLATLATMALKASGVLVAAKAAGAIPKVAGSAVAAGSNAANAALAPLDSVISQIGKVGDALGSMVSKARPDLMQRFSLASEDALAVLGRALAPAFEALANLMRHVGDAIAANEGSFQSLGESLGRVFESLGPLIEAVVQFSAELATALVPVFDALVPAIQALVQAFKPIFRLVASLAELFGGVLGQVLSALTPVIEALAWVIDKLVGTIHDALVAIDKLNPWTDRKKTWAEKQQEQDENRTKRFASVGAAARRATYSSIEDASRQVALSGALAGGKSKEERQIDILGGIHDGINKLIDFAAKQKGSPEDVAKAVEKMKEQLINEQKRQYGALRT